MPFDLFPHMKQLGLPPPVGVLQVGASYGQEMLEFVDNGIRAGVFIEPLKEPYDHLAGLCRILPRFVAVNTLCTERAGQVLDFHVASNGGMSSSILKPARQQDIYRRVTFPDTVRMVSSTVDDVMDFLRENGHGPVTQQLDLLYFGWPNHTGNALFIRHDVALLQ